MPGQPSCPLLTIRVGRCVTGIRSLLLHILGAQQIVEGDNFDLRPLSLLEQPPKCFGHHCGIRPRTINRDHAHISTRRQSGRIKRRNQLLNGRDIRWAATDDQRVTRGVNADHWRHTAAGGLSKEGRRTLRQVRGVGVLEREDPYTAGGCAGICRCVEFANDLLGDFDDPDRAGHHNGIEPLSGRDANLRAVVSLRRAPPLPRRQLVDD